ncbi:MAG: hypothetical protein M3O30_17055 [Planctomycetota bacterium]|nr:hypothetical protein [Planctomycetota bacterium]
MSHLQTITLDPSSDLIGLTAPAPTTAIKRTRHPTGESTTAQTNRANHPALPGFSAADLAGFTSAAPGTYETYRSISAHPTAALVRGMIAAPIVANTWRWKKSRPAVPQEWLTFTRSVLEPLRQSIVRDSLRALEFGWAGFEKIWEIENGRRVLRRLKPLLWDCTQILIDPHGNVAGLLNHPPGKPPVTLAPGKFFLYSHDPEAGNPYGRSRNENIRQAWSESEQIRRRLAQYMKKVAGIVVQLHYPEGTSRDAAGADRPNQWLGQQVLDAVSAGRSVMFPNGFAAATDVRAAYELAGKSPWQLSAFDAATTDHAPGMKLILEYYDALIFRGWLRPERTGLEGRHASRADAKTHTDAATLDSELIDRDLADALNKGVVDDLLISNFGPEARGAVTIDPAPLEPDALGVLRAVLTELLANPAEPIAAKVDVGALLDHLAVPRLAD